MQKAGKRENSAFDTAQANSGAQKADLGRANQTFGQFTNGPANQTPFYKSLVATGTDATNSAYQNVKSNMAARSNAAGFGYASGAAQGAQTQMEGQQARDVGAIPTQAVQASSDMAMRAAQGLQGSGAQEGQQSLGYQNSGTDMYGNRQNRNSILQKSLIDAASRGTGGYR